MTDFLPFQIESLIDIVGYGLLACIVSFIWAPFLVRVLKHMKITRNGDVDATMGIESRMSKANTPIMGGLLVIVTVALITFIFNWERRFTWVPIGVMLLSAGLGGIDDLLNIFGKERRTRSLKQTLTLVRVHNNFLARVYYLLTLPWVVFKRSIMIFGSKQSRGVLAHEKLLLQMAAGGIAAWWIYFKLAENWREIRLPFDGYLDIGWFIIPLIMLIVMFTANAVNISDGMDGLAGGMLIPTFGALSFISWIGGFDALAILNATTAGSLLAYTYWNIKPAKFQMGDVGSLGLGGLLAINALVINQMAILPFLAFMFYADAFSVILQVISKQVFGKRIFKMAPLHHHFEMIGWSEEKTIMRFWVMHAIFIMIGIWVALH